MLKTDYKNDVLDTSKNTERVYNLKNASGEIVEENIRIEDITEYSQEGSKFGANDINATNTEVNRLTTVVDNKQDKLTNPLTKSDVVNALNNTTTNVPLSANQGKVLNDKVGRVRVYVGTDKKLHFVNSEGADSALPFSSGNEIYFGFDTTSYKPYYSNVTIVAPEDLGVVIFTHPAVGSSSVNGNPTTVLSAEGDFGVYGEYATNVKKDDTLSITNSYYGSLFTFIKGCSNIDVLHKGNMTSDTTKQFQLNKDYKYVIAYERNASTYFTNINAKRMYYSAYFGVDDSYNKTSVSVVNDCIKGETLTLHWNGNTEVSCVVVGVY